MLSLIFFLVLVLILLLPLILISFVRNILSVFGLNFMRKKRYKNETRKEETIYTGYRTDTGGARKQSRKKIFDKDDGEYVDFEEIK